MIVITGTAGFIASNLAQAVEAAGLKTVLVDDFSRTDKRANFEHLQGLRIARTQFLEWFAQHAAAVDFVYHLGARTDTTSTDVALFYELNEAYSKQIWELCTTHQIPLVYASSAATYGLGEHGFDDDHTYVDALHPLNEYARSKQRFDQFALRQTQTPPYWIGLKFFNVYGPGESHKGRMASVVWHAFRQIKATGAMKLFRSHRPDVADGDQSRDFIYIDDLVEVLEFFRTADRPSGLYNLGTGQARPFIDLVRAVFESMELAPNISFIDTPTDIRATYQYFTEAKMQKLRSIGYTAPFIPLEEGVRQYVQRHLLPNF